MPCPFELPEEARERLKRYYFEPSVIKRSKDECWGWIYKTKPQNYSTITTAIFGGKRILWKAHRLAWSFHHNCPIPKGLAVCHSCDNKRCPNPNHLFLATQRINIQDAKLKGRMFWQKKKKKQE